MNKIIFVLVEIFTILLVGCGSKNAEISVDGTSQVYRYLYPGENVFVKEEPLVKRELVYDSDGDLIAVYDSEYDDYNRLSQYVYRRYDNEKRVLSKVHTYNYKYDNHFCYEEMIYHEYGDKKANTIYNDRYDTVLTEFYPNEEELVSTKTHYEYVVDNRIITRKSWVEEGKETIREILIDKNGNIVSLRTTNWENEVNELRFYYEYDSDGRKIKEEREGLNSEGNNINRVENYYTYQNGFLVKVSSVAYNNLESNGMKTVTNNTINYGYDENGRMIRKEDRTFSESEIGKIISNGIISIYKYNLDEDIVYKIDSLKANID